MQMLRVRRRCAASARRLPHHVRSSSVHVPLSLPSPCSTLGLDRPPTVDGRASTASTRWGRDVERSDQQGRARRDVGRRGTPTKRPLLRVLKRPGEEILAPHAKTKQGRVEEMGVDPSSKDKGRMKRHAHATLWTRCGMERCGRDEEAQPSHLPLQVKS